MFDCSDRETDEWQSVHRISEIDCLFGTTVVGKALGHLLWCLNARGLCGADKAVEELGARTPALEFRGSFTGHNSGS